MIVGLTGGIGSGKSTVADLWRRQNIAVIDADEVARDVVAPGTEGLKSIVEHFGIKIIDNDGQLNRRLLREQIFENGEQKSWLEQLLHPLIREQIMAQIGSATSSYKVIEAPLLFENKVSTVCDRTVVVDCSVELQLARASLRDDSKAEDIQVIIDAQMERKKRASLADYVIDNSGDLNALELQSLRLHNILMLMTQNKEFL